MAKIRPNKRRWRGSAVALIAGILSLMPVACFSQANQGNRSSNIGTTVTIEAAIAVKISSTGTSEAYPGQLLTANRTLTSMTIDRVSGSGDQDVRFKKNLNYGSGSSQISVDGSNIASCTIYVWALNTTANLTVPATTTIAKDGDSSKVINAQCTFNTSFPGTQSSSISIDNSGDTRQTRTLTMRVTPGQAKPSSWEGNYTGAVVLTIAPT